MATTTSPERQPPAAKKAATAGQWLTPGKGSAAVPAQPSIEEISVAYDKFRVF